jgi:protein gp37
MAEMANFDLKCSENRVWHAPAAVRFIAAEPLLFAVELKRKWLPRAGGAGATIDWMMAGGRQWPQCAPDRPRLGPRFARPVRPHRDAVLPQRLGRFDASWPGYWDTTLEAAERYLDGALRESLPRAGMSGGRLPIGE